MSVANILGRTDATGSTDKISFADGIGDVFVKSLNTAQITAYDPLLAPILVEGGLDFNLTGAVEGLTAVETDALNSRTQQLVSLSGNDFIITGNLVATGQSVHTDALEVGFATERATDTYTGDDNFLQVYGEDTSGINSIKAIRGDLLVSGGDGSASSQGVRSQLRLGTGADVLEGYGGFTYARQDDGSRVRDNLIGHLGFAQVLETDASESPAQWIAGTQSIVGASDAGDLSGASIVAGSLSHILYDSALNGTAHGFVASRNGSGAGTTAGSAFKIVNGSTIIPDWEYGLDMYNPTAIPPSVADMRLSSAGCVHSGAGVPSFATSAGSIYLRRDGGSGSEVVYMNDTGNSGDWVSASTNAPQVDISLFNYSSGATGFAVPTSADPTDVATFTDADTAFSGVGTFYLPLTPNKKTRIRYSITMNNTNSGSTRAGGIVLEFENALGWGAGYSQIQTQILDIKEACPIEILYLLPDTHTFTQVRLLVGSENSTDVKWGTTSNWRRAWASGEVLQYL